MRTKYEAVDLLHHLPPRPNPAHGQVALKLAQIDEPVAVHVNEREQLSHVCVQLLLVDAWQQCICEVRQQWSWLSADRTGSNQRMLGGSVRRTGFNKRTVGGSVSGSVGRTVGRLVGRLVGRWVGWLVRLGGVIINGRSYINTVLDNILAPFPPPLLLSLAN